MARFNDMINTLDNSDIALIRKAEAAGITTFTQGVKALYNDYEATIAAWGAILNPAPVAEEVEEVEVSNEDYLVAVVDEGGSSFSAYKRAVVANGMRGAAKLSAFSDEFASLSHAEIDEIIDFIVRYSHGASPLEVREAIQRAGSFRAFMEDAPEVTEAAPVEVEEAEAVEVAEGEAYFYASAFELIELAESVVRRWEIDWTYRYVDYTDPQVIEAQMEQDIDNFVINLSPDDLEYLRGAIRREFRQAWLNLLDGDYDAEQCASNDATKVTQ